MPDTVTEVATQPAPQAQTSVEARKAGPANVGEAAFAKFLQRDAAPAAPVETAPAQTATEAQTPPANVETEVQEVAPVKTEAAPEAKAQTDDALSKSTSQDKIQFSPEQQELFNKRLGKEIAKREAAEQAAREAATALNELKLNALNTPKPEAQPEQPQIVPLPNGAPPLANIKDTQGLLALQQQAREAVKFAEQQLERDDFNESPPVNPTTNRPFTKAEIREIKWNAKTTIDEHIPQRAQFLDQRAKGAQLAAEKFPFMSDKADPLYVEAQTIRKNNPWLDNIPAADFIVGGFLKGIHVLAAEEAAKGKTPAKAAAARPKPTGGQTEVSTDASPTRVPIGTANRAAITESQSKLTAKRGVGQKDYASFLATQEKLRNSQ